LCRWEDEDPGEEIADLRDAGYQRSHPDQAAIGSFGLVSFGLLDALRRRSAYSLERNARGAMHGPHVAVPSVPGPSRAMMESKIIPGALKAFLDRPA
jgi:hypothetical protein